MRTVPYYATQVIPRASSTGHNKSSTRAARAAVASAWSSVANVAPKRIANSS